MIGIVMGSTSDWETMKAAAKMLEDFGVIYADDDLCGVWAQVMNQARKTGRPIATADAWIAATALWHGIPLVSHDADFSGIAGLQLVTET